MRRFAALLWLFLPSDVRALMRAPGDVVLCGGVVGAAGSEELARVQLRASGAGGRGICTAVQGSFLALGVPSAGDSQGKRGHLTVFQAKGLQVAKGRTSGPSQGSCSAMRHCCGYSSLQMCAR